MKPIKNLLKCNRFVAINTVSEKIGGKLHVNLSAKTIFRQIGFTDNSRMRPTTDMSGYQVCGLKDDYDDDDDDDEDRNDFAEFRVVCTHFCNATEHVILAR